MPKLSALIHAHNDALRIARAVESLRACDEILVIDHGSHDRTSKIAHEHGARIKDAVPGVNSGVYAIDASHDWILCLLPNEAASETLEAAIFEWKHADQDEAITCFAIAVREETDSGWRELGPQTRLVNRKQINWPGELPPANASCPTLDGHVLRFRTP